MDQEEQVVKLTELEHRAKSNTRRIDKLEQQTDALNSLATSVELLVNEQKHQTQAMLEIKKDVTALDSKVDALEKKPAKRWELVVEKIILLIVGAVGALVLGHLGL